MNYMLKYGLGCLLLVLALASCRKEPNYPDEPHITFKRVEQFDHDDRGLQIDSLFLVIGFQDGDGNLGLRTIDTENPDPDSQPPFNQGSPYEKNFIVKLLKQVPDPNNPDEYIFEEFQFPVAGFDLSGRFPRISSDDREEPLEGEIRYGLELTNENEDFFAPGDVIKFEVFIYDRETPVPNKSNVVVSEPITLFE
ncbi:hypothetical protein H7F15_13010 [Pontibacter sp. Tf4]|uniref:hypothetical protein n=1 Tax=Pontibacter sp. Tf4 TaxID=2761620 RepID=UPI001627A96F|nr:hypothetical protein [Pontibacter sp. Tf4]MBB6611963.1 hypothetical protein [Pontibacter sp. Tf4]